MKKATRYVCLFLALVIVVLCFPACHGAKIMNGFILPESFDESKNYEISFWAKNDTNKTQTMIYQQAISDFEKLYPNIKVNIRLYTDYAKIYNDVITNISTNTTPNVCITYPDHIATYMTGENVVVPLDSLFANEEYGFAGTALKFDSPSFDELIPQYIGECKIGDSFYAVPFMRSTEACYVNKDFVEKLGYTLPDILTWDFVWEVSEAAMKKNADGNFAVNGQKVMIPFIYKSTDNMMISMLKQKNAGYSDENGNVLIFNDTTGDFLAEIAEHAGTRAFSTFKISSYPANFLNAGQCIFAVDSTAGATWMGSKAPLSDISEDKIIDFETAVLPIPQFDTENPFMMSQGPSVCIFNKDDSGEVLASWLFTQFLLTNKVQIDYAKTEGYVPVTSKAQDSEEYLTYLAGAGSDNSEHYDIKIKASKLLLDNVDATFVTPVFNGSASLRDAAGQLIENVVKSMRRNEKVDETYIKTLYSDVTSLYRLNSFSVVSGEAENDLGPLPVTAKLLLGALCATWLIIIVYSLVNMTKSRKSRK